MGAWVEERHGMGPRRGRRAPCRRACPARASRAGRPRRARRRPSIVAMRSACPVVTAVASSVAARCSVAARRSAIHMSRSFPEIAPSVPSVTRTPARSMSATGAMPLASLRFDIGLWATLAPVRARMAISSSSSQTQWASTVRASSTPEGVEVADHRPPITRRHRLLLRPGLGGVHGKEPAPRVGEALGGDEALRPDRVGAVREAARAARRRRRRRRRRSAAAAAEPVAGRDPVDRRARRRTCRRWRCAPRAPARRRRPPRGQKKSIVVVTPPSSSSASPSVAPSRTVSRRQDRALGLPHQPSQGSSGRSSISPRNRLSAAWQWVLTSPGISSIPRGVDHLAGVARRSPPPARRARCARRSTATAPSADHAVRGIDGDDERVGDDEIGQARPARSGTGRTRRDGCQPSRRRRRPSAGRPISRPRSSASPSASAGDSREPTASCSAAAWTGRIRSSMARPASVIATSWPRPSPGQLAAGGRPASSSRATSRDSPYCGRAAPARARTDACRTSSAPSSSTSTSYQASGGSPSALSARSTHRAPPHGRA